MRVAQWIVATGAAVSLLTTHLAESANADALPDTKASIKIATSKKDPTKCEVALATSGWEPYAHINVDIYNPTPILDHQEFVATKSGTMRATYSISRIVFAPRVVVYIDDNTFEVEDLRVVSSCSQMSSP